MIWIFAIIFIRRQNFPKENDVINLKRKVLSNWHSTYNIKNIRFVICTERHTVGSIFNVDIILCCINNEKLFLNLLLFWLRVEE